MERISKILMTEFCMALGLSLLIVVLFETDLLPAGWLAGEKSSEFVWAMVMELFTICAIPIALRLFRFGRVSAQLKVDPERALLRWGTLRLLLLCVPMFVNALLYYLYMATSFGYMGLILVLCLFFVYPSRRRCEIETER